MRIKFLSATSMRKSERAKKKAKSEKVNKQTDITSNMSLKP